MLELKANLILDLPYINEVLSYVVSISLSAYDNRRKVLIVTSKIHRQQLEVDPSGCHEPIS